MRTRIGRIFELIDVDRTLGARSEIRGEVLIIIRMTLADIGTRDDDLGTHRTRMQNLFARHLVGDHKDGAIALARADESETKAGVAGRRFDHGAAGFQPALIFGGLDHRPRRTVLDRARRILALEFQKQPARPGIEPCHFDKRRVADEIENGGHVSH